MPSPNTRPSRPPEPARPLRRPAADTAHRAVPRARNRPHGRRRPRWAARGALALSAAVLATSGIGWSLADRLDSSIDRVDPFAGTAARPGGGDDDGLNFLLVGTDGRDGLDPARSKELRLGGEPCNCTDTIMLVHVSADRDRTSVVSIPRDSYADLPPRVEPTGRAGRAGRAGRQAGRAGKINAAYARGGPGLTVRTVERMTGVRIDHYVEVDFTGFMKTVDLVGGVPVCTTHPLKDPHSGLDLPAGTTVLDGGRALQYVRARHLDGSSDLGRMHRQQRFLAQLVETAAGSGFLTDPVRLGRLARTLLDSVRADEGLTAGDLLLLGRAMKDLEPGSSEFVSVPLSGKEVKVPGGGSAVRWDEEEARKLFAAVREDRPLADRADRRPPKRREGVPVDVDPASVRVQVRNGTAVPGLGARTHRALRATGFLTAGPAGNAGRTDVTHTVVSYDPRWDRSVRSLAAALPGARLEPVEGRGATMLVTVGSDFAQRKVRTVRSADPLNRAGANGTGAVTGDQVLCDP